MKRSKVDELKSDFSKMCSIREIPRKKMNGLLGYFSPTEGIRINKQLPNYSKFNVLLHEIGHCICYESCCKCGLGTFETAPTIRNLAMMEFHAFRFCLSELYKRKMHENLIGELEDVCFIFSKFCHKISHEALYMVSGLSGLPIQYGLGIYLLSKSAIWKKCVKIHKKHLLKFVSDNGIAKYCRPLLNGYTKETK